MYQPTVKINRQTLLDLRNSTKPTQKDIWKEKYRAEVKAVSPSLIRSKKRGKRSGHRQRLRGALQHDKIRINLPTIFLTNARSIINKFDELEARLSTDLLKNCCLLAITESWLSSNIQDSQIALEDYTLIRHDRSASSTNKTIGGGLLIYINNKWSDSYKLISTHRDPVLETMAIALRPHWSPREISTIIILIVYCSVFDNQSSSVVKETNNKLHEQLHKLEKKYPDGTIFAVGDFNSASINLPNYKQYVTCSTRKNKTLDKCYINKKVSYKTTQLPALLSSNGQISDHNAVFLSPKYTPTYQNKKQPKQVRMWTEANTEKLSDCFDDTDWSILIPADTDINHQAEVFTSYVNFCTDICVPVKSVRDTNDKPWITPQIKALLSQRRQAVGSRDQVTAHRLRSVIQREMREARKLYTQKVESRFQSKPAEAWSGLKSVLE